MRVVAASLLTVSLVVARPALAEADFQDDRRPIDRTPRGAHEPGFPIEGDPDSSLSIGGQLQFRYAIARRRDRELGDDRTTLGFAATRTAVWAEGELHGGDVFFVVQANILDGEGTFELEDAIAGFALSETLTLEVGQMTLPIIWEELLFEEAGLAADQSVVNAVFNPGDSQGVMLTGEHDAWRWFAAFSDGVDGANSRFNDPNKADYALSARADVLLAGDDWERFERFTGYRTEHTHVRLGGAVHWQQGGRTGATEPRDNEDALLWSVDLQAQGDGWNLYGAFVGAHTDLEHEGSRSDFGALVQGGVFVSDEVELFARWDAVFADSAREASRDFHALTAGANWYPIAQSQAVKFTLDGSWYFDPASSNELVAEAADNDAARAGLLPSDRSGLFAARAQLQILF